MIIRSCAALFAGFTALCMATSAQATSSFSFPNTLPQVPCNQVPNFENLGDPSFDHCVGGGELPIGMGPDQIGLNFGGSQCGNASDCTFGQTPFFPPFGDPGGLNSGGPPPPIDLNLDGLPGVANDAGPPLEPGSISPVELNRLILDYGSAGLNETAVLFSHFFGDGTTGPHTAFLSAYNQTFLAYRAFDETPEGSRLRQEFEDSQDYVDSLEADDPDLRDARRARSAAQQAYLDAAKATPEYQAAQANLNAAETALSVAQDLEDDDDSYTPLFFPGETPQPTGTGGPGSQQDVNDADDKIDSVVDELDQIIPIASRDIDPQVLADRN